MGEIVTNTQSKGGKEMKHARGGLFHSNFQERVKRAAEAALKRSGTVGPLELFQEMGLLQAFHVESWRKGDEDYPVLQPWIQVGPEKFQ